MCIIRGPVDSVKKTNIFVAPSTDFSQQLTVYSNEVTTGAANMMILPVPYPETVSFKAVYPTLFSDAAASFTEVDVLTENPLLWRGSSPKLEVFRVGPYNVSIALSLADLDRIDADQLEPVSEELRYMLARTYGPDLMPVPYGFICCALQPGANTYEPLAYTHRALETGLFVPTKHFHGAEEEVIAKDWDHAVYSVRTSLAEAHTPGIYPRRENAIRWSALPDGFRYGPGEPLCKWLRKGEYTNKDLLLPFQRQAEPSRPATPPSPTGRGLATLLKGLRGIFTS
jgi:hypothetical protein